MNIRAGSFAIALLLSFGVTGKTFAQDEMPKEEAASAKRARPPAALPAPVEQEPSIAPAGTMLDQPVAMLQALDKITARVRRVTVKVGQSIAFGTLSIQVDACRKSPPEDPPESAAFLKIVDSKSGATPKQVFSGWMFSSSPALSAMDNPVYDIWVVDCASDTTVSTSAAH